jgi:catechol 2,3-dioxygenase-like lactoylglutathione lyase family enzyme
MKQGRRRWLTHAALIIGVIGLKPFKGFTVWGNKMVSPASKELSGQLLLNDIKMKLGAFSVSLNVKDLAASHTFYENLGFTKLGGDGKHYLIMKNGNALIGLFQGMFEKNILTFNPGWDESGKNEEIFTDIRDLQRELKTKGVQFVQEADEKTTGPASFIITDPDGNPVLVDQHR